MGKACIINYNNYGKRLLEKLLAEERIVNFWNAGGPKLCFEFKGELEINLSDFLDIVPDYMTRDDKKLEFIISLFKKAILLPILDTKTGCQLLEYGDTIIVLHDTEKTEVVCIRMSPNEKYWLKKIAEEKGTTISEMIRSLIHEHLLK